MFKLTSFFQKIKSSYKSCLINLIILLVTTILMLLLAEGLFRWIDGYEFSSLELERQEVTVEPFEQQ